MGADGQLRRGPDTVQNFDPGALRAARVVRGLSHDRLGERIAIKRPTLIHYEKGRRRPTPRLLVRLAEGLEVDPLDLTTATLDTATLADLRARAGLSRNQAASALRVSRATFDAIEGGNTLDPKIAGPLAELLGVSLGLLHEAHHRSGETPVAPPPG